MKAFLYFPMRCSEADATKREEFLKLEPMQRELLEQLPDLQLLLEALKKSDLDVIRTRIHFNRFIEYLIYLHQTNLK